MAKVRRGRFTISANIFMTSSLITKTECCGVGTSFLSSFTSSYWYTFGDRHNQTVPVQCCVSQTVVYPYESRYDVGCTAAGIYGHYHPQGCDTAVEKRLKMYSIPFFVFMAVIVLEEISCIMMTIYDGVHLPSEPNRLQENVTETEKIKDNIEIQSLGETQKKKEIMGTNTEEMLDSKQLNKTKNTNDDKTDEADTIDQHKNDETENMNQEKGDKTMKDTTIQITKETASDRTELKDKLIADFDVEDLVKEDL
ncbi:unnamed protein product [Mytilus coruscus]|uniref:Uncharacterized protein n=1 Tax=Mytilus coruscus TaxID=42192 RepID=A0A6J8B9T8_MYTCO|nr:unnamed protein product [Mytilus coruscus]